MIDATGMTVYPGLIDSETSLGLTEISADRMTNDEIETSDEIMPHMHVYDAFHAETALIPVTRINGITNAIVAPANGDTLPGQDIFIQLAGASATEMLTVRTSPCRSILRGAAPQQSFESGKISFHPHGNGDPASSGFHGRPGLRPEARGLRKEEIRMRRGKEKADHPNAISNWKRCCLIFTAKNPS